MWNCPLCKNRNSDEVTTCRACGLIRAGPATSEKYRVLGGYLPQLSKIMRNYGYEHYLVDACAGSGMVYDPERRLLIEGSPLIMGRVREKVDGMIKDKTKQPEAKCVFIEVEDSTFGLLERYTRPFSAFAECIHGDCNTELDKVLDKISSDTKEKNHFAFVYIDPFGFGKPTITRDTVERVLRRRFTELVMHFTWEGVSRLAGYAMKKYRPGSKEESSARSYSEILDAYLGEGWWEIEKKNLAPSRRRQEYLQLYASKLQEHYKHALWTEIPIASSNPNYYLFFATRNDAGKEIMANIIQSIRRKGAKPLETYPTTKQDGIREMKGQAKLEDYFFGQETSNRDSAMSSS